VPPQIIRGVPMELAQLVDDAHVPPSWEESAYSAAALKVHGKVVGVVGILPPTFFERFDSVMIAGGFLVLAVTICLFSIAVVAPVRSRLMDLQMAARRLGTGELTARARTDGDDEVSEVAHRSIRWLTNFKSGD
jgi:methyl-accepting chemotaxis protein